MQRFIGLDVHKQSSTAVVLGPSGKKLREQVLETNAQVLKDFVRSIPPERVLTIEEGALSDWLYEELEPLVKHFVVIQPPQGERGQKSDLLDAWKLADRTRRGDVPAQVYKEPFRFRELREAVRAHLVLQRDMVRAKNRLNALCASRGVNGVAKQLYDPLGRHDVLARLPEHHAKRARLWGDELDMLVECHERAEQWLLEVGKRTDAVRRLMTAPGIGPIRAAQIVATVLTPHRFRTKRQFWSYCGLGIVMRSSSDYQRDHRGDWRFRNDVPATRGLNRNRHPLLKQAFKGAARQVTVHMPQHPLTQHYQRLLEQTKPNLARLTIARRISAAVLMMWKHEKDYDLTKQQRR
jgi:transposase